MRRNRKVKILATLGPSSSDQTTISRLHKAGADAFRINMSHTSHDRLRELIQKIRAVEAENGRPITILADLQGPKLRIGTFADGPQVLEIGQRFILDADPAPGNLNRVYLPHPEILEALQTGHRLLIDDGKLRLRVLSCEHNTAVTEVEVGGKISDRKGVSLPDTLLSSGALTDKDRADLDAVLETNEVDWIAMSFVQRADDVVEVKEKARGRACVMAKIEKPQAIDALAEIIEVSDALMVARGDLGVELPLELVPGLQKRIIRGARRAGKPVVVATQMLESMITSPVPTRAEVSDVATAVFEGADAVMLSAESAAGAYPVEAVATMNRIAEEIERDSYFPNIISTQRPEPLATGPDAIAAAARQISETLNLPAIICLTERGTTGLRASRERARTPIIVISRDRRICRRLSLVWGLHCIVSEDTDATSVEAMVDHSCRIALQEKFGKPGDRIIIIAGVPFGRPGGTNMLRMAYLGGDSAGSVAM